jgi:putative DNA primase/helicase
VSGAANYDDVLTQLRLAGLIVDHIETGRMRRCRVEGERTRKGWYALHEVLTNDQTLLLVGSYGIWQGNEPNSQKIDLHKQKLSPDGQAALRDRLKQDKARVEAQRKRENEKAARIAEEAWQKCLPVGESEYLARKGVQSYGLRFTESGSIAIPLLDGFGRIHGLQFILPKGHKRRKKNGDTEKEFWPAGLAVKGNYFLIGTPVDVLLVCEGYATAASLHEATGLPVAVAFNANNLLPVSQALRKRYQNVNMLICADDDYLVKCHAKSKPNGNKCLTYNLAGSTECRVCASWLDPKSGRAGTTSASAAAMAVNGAWVAPVFAAERPIETKGPTDFNDLHLLEGLHVVRSQIEAKLLNEWASSKVEALTNITGQGGALKPLLNVPEAVERFSLIYGAGGTLYDHQEYQLIPKSDVLDICVDHCWREWKLHSERKVVKLTSVGFDPTERDKSILCNLWGGWPTVPKKGSCEILLGLLKYLCSGEEEGDTDKIYQWVLKWLAYPIQHRGAKMRTALIFHGPQGVGKNLFFEAYSAIFGEYGRTIGQAEIDDKFNEWASRKLFMIADEVMARQELYHQKNKIKSMITSETIRINPKNVTAHDERNHVNFVFLSNEVQPLVLEKDDRRFVVIWVPDKLPDNYYSDVADEIAAGGVAALHDHLLQLDLGDFTEHSKPPMTQAKQDLIDINMESGDRFVRDWVSGELGLPIMPADTSDIYRLYQHYAKKQGVPRPREHSQLIGNIGRIRGWKKERPRVWDDFTNLGDTHQATVMVPPEDITETKHRMGTRTKAVWLSESRLAFAEIVDVHLGVIPARGGDDD